MNNTYYSSGDLGDVIACLPIIKHMGGGRILLGTRPWTKAFTTERFDYIAPLLRAQPYITAVERWDDPTPSDVTVDFSHFRNHWRGDETLVDMQARQAGLEPHQIDRQSPWLTIPEIDRHNKIFVCRSTRHQGYLHWHELWRRKAKECFFVGLREDYDAFNANCFPWGPLMQHRNKPTIPFKPVQNALETAQLIKASRACVLNQSSALWIAIGLKQPHLLVEQVNQDSYFPSLPNIRYVATPHANPTANEWDKI